eukprot:m.238428 g.238428  ORF g.238428 m.238428 type:complete len:78 (-) comp15288_c0_seq18:743-976(-)
MNASILKTHTPSATLAFYRMFFSCCFTMDLVWLLDIVVKKSLFVWLPQAFRSDQSSKDTTSFVVMIAGKRTMFKYVT